MLAYPDPQFCDFCILAAQDEFGATSEDGDEHLALVLLQLGDELPDHLCDNVEVEAGMCDCRCNRLLRRSYLP